MPHSYGIFSSVTQSGLSVVHTTAVRIFTDFLRKAIWLFFLVFCFVLFILLLSGIVSDLDIYKSKSYTLLLKLKKTEVCSSIREILQN